MFFGFLFCSVKITKYCIFLGCFSKFDDQFLGNFVEFLCTIVLFIPSKQFDFVSKNLVGVVSMVSLMF